MPSRVIRGEIVSSDSLSKVSLQAELLFVHLILCADDYGRLDGRTQILRSACFPSRPEIGVHEMQQWLGELASCDGDESPLFFYECNGKPYVQLRNWEKHRSNGKRSGKSKFPEPSAGIRGDPREIPGIRPSDVCRVASDEGRASGQVAERPKKKSAARRSSAANVNGAAPPEQKQKPAYPALIAFHEEFKAARGFPTVVPYKDKPRLGEAYADLGEDDFRAALRVFFSLEEPWIRDASFSAAAFLGALPKCANRVRGRAAFQASRRVAQAGLPLAPPPLPSADVSALEQDATILSMFHKAGTF